jgi:hypothetical protein
MGRIMVVGAIAAGALSGLTGCRTSGDGEAAAADQTPVPAPTTLVTGAFEPVQLETAPEPMQADAASSEVVGRVELLEWQGDGPRVRRRLVVERSGPGPGETAWTVRRTLLTRVGGGADEATALRADTCTMTAEGAVAVIEEINLEDNVEVVFQPAMVVMPRELTMGTPFEQTFDMKVYPGGKPRSMLKTSGPATQKIELTGLWRVPLAGGTTAEARGVRSEFRADLPPAKVINTSEQWFVDGVGLIAERRHERTTVLGLPIHESYELWVARDAGGR